MNTVPRKRWNILSLIRVKLFWMRNLNLGLKIPFHLPKNIAIVLQVNYVFNILSPTFVSNSKFVFENVKMWEQERQNMMLPQFLNSPCAKNIYRKTRPTKTKQENALTPFSHTQKKFKARQKAGKPLKIWFQEFTSLLLLV